MKLNLSKILSVMVAFALVITTCVSTMSVSAAIYADEFTCNNHMQLEMQDWQEGAIYDGKLFAFKHDGNGWVYDIKTKKKLSTINLEGNFTPHCNSACFGVEKYNSNDKYPLLYVNVYNNYKDYGSYISAILGSPSTYRLEGVCFVYRITENGSEFKAELVQAIQIDFTEDLNLWKSLENNGDTRPYGNFVVDIDNNELYAYVMRDKEWVTRFFNFNVPTVKAGTYNNFLGCNIVKLGVGDIKSQFDIGYMNYMQGCDYANGKIFSVEGIPNGSDYFLKVIDLKKKVVEKEYNLSAVNIRTEPQIVAFARETDKIYFAPRDSILRELTFINFDDVNFRQENGVWYLFENGVKSNKTSLVNYIGETRYIVNGIWDTKFTGTVEHDGEIVYISSGILNTSFTAVAPYKNRYIYFNKGIFDSSKNTTILQNGKTIEIVNGVLSSVHFKTNNISFEYGDIISGNNQNADLSIIRTKNILDLNDYQGLKIASGYDFSITLYKDGKYQYQTDWISTGKTSVEYSLDSLFAVCPDANQFRIKLSVADKANDIDILQFDSIVSFNVRTTVNCQHFYTDECDEECNRCSYIREAIHNYSSNSCVEKQVCNSCGKVSDKTFPHYFNVTVTKIPTCATEGERIYKCKVCNYTLINKIAKLNTHSYKTTKTNATLGKNGLIVKKCTVCNFVASETVINYPKTFTLSTTSYTYSGSTKKPTVTIKDSQGKKLKNGSDYTVAYKNNKYVGTATVTVSMKGNYSGTKTLTFKINPKATSLSKLTAGAKSLKVYVKKQSTQVTGYEIQYSTSKKFTSAKKLIISSYKTTTKTIKKLNSKKTYYVRVRTYKTVNGKKYYSSWSKVLYKKTK